MVDGRALAHDDVRVPLEVREETYPTAVSQVHRLPGRAALYPILDGAVVSIEEYHPSESSRMGTFTVRATLSHPEHRGTALTLDLLADTGATWSLIPSEAARSLGVEPSETRPVRTADGRRLDFPLGEVRFTIDGRTLTSPCLISAAPDAPALLGAVTLEAFGLAADPVQKILVPVTGLLL